MTRAAASINSEHGFTLLEIIATLIMISITAAIMFPVMGTGLIKSSQPVTRLNDHHLLIQEMDKWTGIYRNAIQNNTLDITNFKTNVDSNANYLDSTAYINSFNGGIYTTQGTNKILRIRLLNNEQSLVALFAE
jgi:prepilin-type N-terminal cleavage/methylation domain-containing protein